MKCCVSACPAGLWGLNCENVCRCDVDACNSGHGCASCGSMLEGWTGPNCDEDIDECQTAAQVCGANSDCRNTNGSYVCDCHSWYRRFSDKCTCKYSAQQHTYTPSLSRRYDTIRDAILTCARKPT